MESCPTCQKPLVRGSASETSEIAGRRFHAQIPAMLCEHCGADFIADEDLERFELAIASHLARGRASGEAFVYMRRALGLKASDLAELLHTRPETVSRWERGVRSMDWRAFALLGKLVLERAEGSDSTRRYLEQLKTSDATELVELGELAAP